MDVYWLRFGWLERTSRIRISGPGGLHHETGGQEIMTRNRCIGASFLTVLIVLAAAYRVLEKRAAVQAAGVQAPMFELDPLWPKPLPNHWLLGMAIGVSVDAQDHVWIIHRGAGTLEANEMHAATNPPIAMCCSSAPPVLEFDQEGNLLRHWGGPGNGF